MHSAVICIVYGSITFVMDGIGDPIVEENCKVMIEECTRRFV